MRSCFAIKFTNLHFTSYNFNGRPLVVCSFAFHLTQEKSKSTALKFSSLEPLTLFWVCHKLLMLDGRVLGTFRDSQDKCLHTLLLRLLNSPPIPPIKTSLQAPLVHKVRSITFASKVRWHHYPPKETVHFRLTANGISSRVLVLLSRITPRFTVCEWWVNGCELLL